MKTTNFKPKFIEKRPPIHSNSEHPKSLKESTPYSQPLRVKRICSTAEDYLLLQRTQRLIYLRIQCQII